MDSSPLANMLPNFLEPLVGKPGKAVLDNLVKGEEQLRAFVLPRIIVGWLRTVGDGNVSLPNGSPFSSLRKSAAYGSIFFFSSSSNPSPLISQIREFG